MYEDIASKLSYKNQFLNNSWEIAQKQWKFNEYHSVKYPNKVQVHVHYNVSLIENTTGKYMYNNMNTHILVFCFKE